MKKNLFVAISDPEAKITKITYDGKPFKQGMEID